MIECESLGKILLYDRSGKQHLLDHETTVRMCELAQEEGIGIDEAIKRNIEPSLKLLKFLD
ncbi:MAG: hypothetical protein QW597_06975 [Thermoplasmataceae archaeon]